LSRHASVRPTAPSASPAPLLAPPLLRVRVAVSAGRRLPPRSQRRGRSSPGGLRCLCLNSHRAVAAAVQRGDGHALQLPRRQLPQRDEAALPASARHRRPRYTPPTAQPAAHALASVTAAACQLSPRAHSPGGCCGESETAVRPQPPLVARAPRRPRLRLSCSDAALGCCRCVCVRGRLGRPAPGASWAAVHPQDSLSLQQLGDALTDCWYARRAAAAVPAADRSDARC